MKRIQQLLPHVIARIAAGEVIERPASVVKELLENAVDAGSRRIDIELEQGGIDFIRVADDGCGIPADDLALAFAQHATSKLTDAEDLFRIGTLGFRGEALSSIAGIAKVLLQSRPASAAVGAEIASDGGTLSDVRPWGGSPGTRIEVRHLFFNVPVRKKFLKSVATELSHTCETVTRIALANPGLHLTLRHNGKLVYDIPASATLPDRIALFFGADIRDALYLVDTGPGAFGMTGYVADPTCDRGNAKLQYLFVNGRWFRDRSLAYALQEAYRGLLMTGRYAVGFLFLSVPPDQVDVNVHPTKAEVRFRENSAIFSLIRNAVKARLLKENLVPKMVAPAEGAELSREPAETLFSPRREYAEQTIAPWDKPNAPPIPIERLPETGATPVEPPPLPFALPPMPEGTGLQVHDSYIVLETPTGMLVIDQHALHERILYEQFRRRVRDGKLEVQRLLIPEPIDLPPAHAAAVLEAQDALRELGLEVAPFGGNTIVLSSYPALLARRPAHEIFSSIVDHLMSKERAPSKEALFDHLIATMACKAAVKAGDKLTAEEIHYLLQLRLMAEDSHHCPHGRPTSLLFSRQDLDRQFRRT